VNAWRRIAEGAAADYAAFLGALAKPRDTQLAHLHAILTVNRNSEFGRHHGFDVTRDADEFRARVPIHSYADVAQDIARMTRGARDVLCAEPVRAYEETGGSSGGAKLIPYTDESLAAFRRALLPWFADLIRSRPGISSGRAYWALSPVACARRMVPDGTPIGLSSEAEYLGPDLAPYFSALSVVSPVLTGVRDMDTWRYLTLRFLLDAEDLTLISVWSPTFLFPLLEALVAQRERLVEDVALGKVSDLPEEFASLALGFTPKPERAQAIARALNSVTPDMRTLWPRLDTISCWTDAGSRRFVARLHEQFPQAFIQGKGLLATEGVVTIPLVGQDHSVLALHSGFYEFLDERGVSYMCDELKTGETYRVVLTTHGGLYRYDLGDRVRVRGWVEETPTLEFVGRVGLVSDLCGEKITEEFVAARLVHTPGFSMLAPVLTPDPHYVLFLDRNEYAAETACNLASTLDVALMDNPQYLYARRLGQLGPVQPRLIPEPLKRYVQSALGHGQRLGNVKPPVLRVETDWEQRLAVI
jgi:hypothetical protein